MLPCLACRPSCLETRDYLEGSLHNCPYKPLHLWAILANIKSTSDPQLLAKLHSGLLAKTWHRRVGHFHVIKIEIFEYWQTTWHKPPWQQCYCIFPSLDRTRFPETKREGTSLSPKVGPHYPLTFDVVHAIFVACFGDIQDNACRLCQEFVRSETN